MVGGPTLVDGETNDRRLELPESHRIERARVTTSVSTGRRIDNEQPK
jgi:hypothetical protein